jgi:hypothetical protein
MYPNSGLTLSNDGKLSFVVLNPVLFVQLNGVPNTGQLSVAIETR